MKEDERRWRKQSKIPSCVKFCNNKHLRMNPLDSESSWETNWLWVSVKTAKNILSSFMKKKVETETQSNLKSCISCYLLVVDDCCWFLLLLLPLHSSWRERERKKFWKNDCVLLETECNIQETDMYSMSWSWNVSSWCICVWMMVKKRERFRYNHFAPQSVSPAKHKVYE